MGEGSGEKGAGGEKRVPGWAGRGRGEGRGGGVVGEFGKGLGGGLEVVGWKRGVGWRRECDVRGVRWRVVEGEGEGEWRGSGRGSVWRRGLGVGWGERCGGVGRGVGSVVKGRWEVVAGKVGRGGMGEGWGRGRGRRGAERSGEGFVGVVRGVVSGVGRVVDNGGWCARGGAGKGLGRGRFW